jgi:hypothetical protein
MKKVTPYEWTTKGGVPVCEATTYEKLHVYRKAVKGFDFTFVLLEDVTVLSMSWATSVKAMYIEDLSSEKTEWAYQYGDIVEIDMNWNIADEDYSENYKEAIKFAKLLIL